MIDEPASALEKKGCAGQHAGRRAAADRAGMGVGFVVGFQPLFKGFAALGTGVFVNIHG